jgi:hypothetical protein
MSGAYCYCVGSSELAGEWGSNGIGGERVYAVRAGPVAALVSAVPGCLGAAVPPSTREHLLAHDFVVWAAARERSVLPVAFGTVFRSDADVVAALDALRDAALAALAALGNRVELGVRLSWGGEGAPPDAASLVASLRGAVGERAAAVVPMPPVGERTLLCSALLVARADVYDVAARVREMADRLQPALRATVSGPWAPYHFARLRLRVDPGPRARPGDTTGRRATPRDVTS